MGLSVLGATGKMGKRILELALKDPEFHIISAFSRRQPEGAPPSDPLTALLECDVAIDFTFHQATKEHLNAALKAGKPIVIGTTGHSQEEIKEIEEASGSIPILYSPNFSFGMALCLDAASRLGRALYRECTITIVETHHIHKKDSPSGTAFALAKAIGYGRIVTESTAATPRQKEEIVICSIRSGEVIGEHHILFECGHERIELKHTSHSRDAFASGALMGANFLVKQPPGLYSLKDLFKHG